MSDMKAMSHMKTIILNQRNFKQVIEQHPFVIVLFTADWCEPCQLFDPIFEAEASYHTEIIFAKVDIDENPNISDFFNIQHAPTLLAIREKIVIDGTHGAMNAEELSQLIQLWKNINTTEINRHFAKNQVSSPQLP
jgi:thioredoxin 1